MTAAVTAVRQKILIIHSNHHLEGSHIKPLYLCFQSWFRADAMAAV